MPDPKELNAQIVNDAFAAQQSELDKIWYQINLEAYSQSVGLAVSFTRPYDVDDLPPDQQEKALQNLKQNGSDERFSEQEKQQLQIPHEENERSKVYRLTRPISDSLTNRLMRLQTMEEESIFHQQTGLIGAKIAVEFGKEYYKNLDLLPEDEPNREEKAIYLTLNDNSQTNLLFTGYKNYQNDVDQTLAQYGYSGKEQASPAADPEMLKTMTLDEYLDLSFESKEEKEKYVADRKADGINCTLQSNAYQVLRQTSDKFSQQPISDKKLGQHAFKSTYISFRRAHAIHARNLAGENLPPEDKKFFEIGVKLMDTQAYQTPKSIREWVEKKGNRMLQEKRVQNLNQANAFFKSVLAQKKPMQFEQSREFKETFKKPGFFASDYDKYLSKHLGIRATLGQSFEQQKAHLARAIAATAQKEGGRDFSTDRIHTWAKAIQGKDFFKDLSPREVANALIDQKSLNSLRMNMIRHMYGVPKERQTAYIEQMKKLQQNMMSTKNASDKYKALVKSVSDIAKLDPSAPDTERKLMMANETLLNSIKTYATGKKNVRTFEGGRQRFDNCMDAMAILALHVPGMHQEAKAMEDRVNEVRKAPEGHEDHLDLRANYGAERAAVAKQLREKSPEPQNQIGPQV
ncbi:MAG: hypothetical protein J6P72_09610 [Firmicutes bacterium]|nr:hypothetical protein [Bacillota bacterium]